MAFPIFLEREYISFILTLRHLTQQFTNKTKIIDKMFFFQSVTQASSETQGQLVGTKEFSWAKVWQTFAHENSFVPTSCPWVSEDVTQAYSKTGHLSSPNRSRTSGLSLITSSVVLPLTKLQETHAGAQAI